MDPIAAFSPDYFTARQRFRDAADRQGWAVESHPIAATGPNGEPLTIDVAATPEMSHEKTLILSSGVHGVEGPFGSAVQLGLIERWGRTPPIRCVMIHAVNPFGFAHRRRFNEENVDQNRNFLLPGQDYGGSPDGYAELDSILNPRRPPPRVDPFPLRAVWNVMRHGLPKLKQAIAAGQYDHPKGIFFGGSGPSESHRILAAHFPRWLGQSRRVVHFDYHTGLGARGAVKLLLDTELTNHRRRQLTDWFGADTFEVCHHDGLAYDARGGFGLWCEAVAGDRDYLFACTEFGTYGPISMLGGLKRENQAYHWCKPNAPSTERAKRELAELFCPAAAEWRERVVNRSWSLVDAAVTGLSAT